MASPTASASTDPPYYVLISHSQSLNIPSVPTSTSLSHPVIEYHYADDAPISLLPQYPGEHVLVLDYDPGRPGTPTVKSLSPDLVVSALKVADPPGASVAGEPAITNNSNIYVIETIPKPPDNSAAEGDEQHVHAVLAQFKQRNAVLRRILDYPYGNGASPVNGLQSTNGAGQETATSSTPQT
ncbi:hypothetical protein BD309DRAFT_949702 [Dichomitus squalens]|uniref:uncharacterized protein n=1 Tax=Dichomitus squalens (strain LYAD-421) TaxID=732165 RepID=UPI0004415E3C|nr:uncharacterized protein DICSQDRAFT_46800 [Dichomitus squalens LYAD-421 SS1]EJF66629.1 hypothetical protein DICSQDRAFT_46800 [Dichomitus squalens LYAD-421 SS1]TBU48404.1 hypothetical protein BD309DRAFT_949702 [Dichomitus squalens]